MSTLSAADKKLSHSQRQTLPLTDTERQRMAELDDVVASTPPLLTLKQAADLLGLSIRTLQRYIRSGRLPCIKLCEGGSGGVRISRQSIREFLRERLS